MEAIIDIQEGAGGFILEQDRFEDAKVGFPGRVSYLHADLVIGKQCRAAVSETTEYRRISPENS